MGPRALGVWWRTDISLEHAGILSSDRPAPSVVTMLKMLSRLKKSKTAF
jgi:hypothetical protein